MTYLLSPSLQRAAFTISSLTSQDTSLRKHRRTVPSQLIKILRSMQTVALISGYRCSLRADLLFPFGTPASTRQLPLPYAEEFCFGTQLKMKSPAFEDGIECVCGAETQHRRHGIDDPRWSHIQPHGAWATVTSLVPAFTTAISLPNLIVANRPAGAESTNRRRSAATQQLM